MHSFRDSIHLIFPQSPKERALVFSMGSFMQSHFNPVESCICFLGLQIPQLRTLSSSLTFRPSIRENIFNRSSTLIIMPLRSLLEWFRNLEKPQCKKTYLKYLLYSDIGYESRIVKTFKLIADPAISIHSEMLVILMLSENQSNIDVYSEECKLLSSILPASDQLISDFSLTRQGRLLTLKGDDEKSFVAYDLLEILAPQTLESEPFTKESLHPIFSIKVEKAEATSNTYNSF